MNGEFHQIQAPRSAAVGLLGARTKGQTIAVRPSIRSVMTFTSIVIRPATCPTIGHRIVRASRSWNAHRDGGDCEYKRESYPAQHDRLPVSKPGLASADQTRGTRIYFQGRIL